MSDGCVGLGNLQEKHVHPEDERKDTERPKTVWHSAARGAKKNTAAKDKKGEGGDAGRERERGAGEDACSMDIWGGERVLLQRLLIKLEPFGVEIQGSHVAKMALMLRTEVQAPRRACHNREAGSRRRDIPCRRYGPVCSVTDTP